MSLVHLVVPDGVDDPARPSGGNTYDRRLRAGLAALGWAVREHTVVADACCGTGGYPASALGEVLDGIPDGAVVLLDGLVATSHPEVLCPRADRLRLVVLVHLPLGLGEPAGGVEVRAREEAALRGVAHVVTTSRWTRHWLLDAYGLDPGRVTVAAPGVDPAPHVAGEPAGRRLLCVGAVIPAKGHDVLLEALARVTGCAWACELVGSLERDPVFVEHLRLRALELGIADRVRFRGALVGPALDAAYARADLVVTASHGETYGMVVTEALAHGIPVLATRVGGLPEALAHTPGGRRPGVLVPPGDPAALAGAIEQWLGDARLRQHLRRAAGERRPLLPPWSATSAAVAAVLAGVDA
ncbi:MAG: glycosyltransferase family 4 protein [Ornithinibacter sp.]